MMIINMIGQKFGRLTVTEKARTDRHGQAVWKCVCDCGRLVDVRGRDMRSGNTLSCGCIKAEMLHVRAKHRMCNSSEYKAWAGMIQRCTNPSRRDFPRYGGKGLTVDKRWLDFTLFYSDMGPKPSEKHSIDRINNQLGYSPENCRWASLEEQARNKGICSRNKTGKSGVCWHKRIKKYGATIGHDGKQEHLGYFSNINDAINARKNGEIQHWGSL